MPPGPQPASSETPPDAVNANAGCVKFTVNGAVKQVEVPNTYLTITWYVAADKLVNKGFVE